MWVANSRQVFKQTLSFTKVKILYTRVTLTRITTLYFFFALIVCIILSGLQGITFKDNSEAVSAIGSAIGPRRTDEGLVVLDKRTLRLCTRSLNQAGTDCLDVLTFGEQGLRSRGLGEDGSLNRRQTVSDPLSSDDSDSDSDSGDESDLDDDGDESSDDEGDVIISAPGVEQTTTSAASTSSVTSASAATTTSTTTRSTTTSSPSPVIFISTSTERSSSSTVSSSTMSRSTVLTLEESSPPSKTNTASQVVRTSSIEDGSSTSTTEVLPTTTTEDTTRIFTTTEARPTTATIVSTTSSVTRTVVASTPSPTIAPEDTVINNSPGSAESANSGLDDTCIFSLRWLDETVHDAQREDVVTFAFQLWLFVLAVVTVLNQSIPHLIAGILGHVLGAAWSAYRITSIRRLKTIYQEWIVPEACNGQDILDNWWDIKTIHAIPIVVFSCTALVVSGALSYKLFSVYANESFSRVGASAKIHRMYKTVLLFSVCLQLSGFFSITSIAMWIDKICHGSVIQLARHSKLYLALFIVILLISFPWFILGWLCVRKECKIRFFVFLVLSLAIFSLSSAMFASALYRFIFSSWALFGTMTVTAYILILATTILAILCRLNFGKGLAEYLQVKDALEGIDFTPVVFTKPGIRDLEKYNITDEKLVPVTPPEMPIPLHLPLISQNKATNPGELTISSERARVPMYLFSSAEGGLSPAPSRVSRVATQKSTTAPYSVAQPMDDDKFQAMIQQALPATYRSSYFTRSQGSVASTSSASSRGTNSTSPISACNGVGRKQALPANSRGSRGVSGAGSDFTYLSYYQG